MVMPRTIFAGKRTEDDTSNNKTIALRTMEKKGHMFLFLEDKLSMIVYEKQKQNQF